MTMYMRPALPMTHEDKATKTTAHFGLTDDGNLRVTTVHESQRMVADLAPVDATWLADAINGDIENPFRKDLPKPELGRVFVNDLEMRVVDIRLLNGQIEIEATAECAERTQLPQNATMRVYDRHAKFLFEVGTTPAQEIWGEAGGTLSLTVPLRIEAGRAVGCNSSWFEQHNDDPPQRLGQPAAEGRA